MATQQDLSASFETFLFDLSSTFIGLPEESVDVNMTRGLARVGEFLRMDRVTLLELSRNREEMTTVYSWSADGVAPPAGVLTRQMQPWWIGQVLRGDVTLASRLDDLPDEARAERTYLRDRGVVSAASIPLRVGGEIAGALSFITVRRYESWTPELVRRLKATGDVLWNALKRYQAMQALVASRRLLAESEARFRLVANTAPVMIWMADEANQFAYVNQPWLAFTGRPLAEELGTGWLAELHPEDVDRRVQASVAAFKQRQPFQVEYRQRRHDGVYRWIFAQGVPRFDPDGSFAGYIGSAVDVTERKEVEALLSMLSQQLMDAQEQERARVARELHDEVNQRLALLVLGLDGIRQRVRGVMPEVIDEINNTIDAAANLTKDIQNLSHRLHPGRLRTVGLELAAREVCRELSERSKVDIEFLADGVADDLAEDLSVCLYRVLQEALQNALKHSASRRILVSLRSETTALSLTVQDSGIGFDPAAVNTGGLGLISMRERLKLIDGTLVIQTTPGGGTTICARAPLKSGSRATGMG